MTAAYRLKGLGWFASCVAIVLGFYLVSLQVAAERKRLDDVNGRIGSAERDIRALETEFDTRANLAQLEKWNGDTLALAAPTAGQFIASEAALASLDVNGPVAGGAGVRTAALVVPSLPDVLPRATTPAPAATPQATVQTAAAAPVAARPVARALARVEGAVIRASTPMRALAAAMPDRAAVAKVRPQAVAMLDRKLLSDSTIGDILSGARREAGRLR